jgi:uncharacterized delta-60 repeat protein
MRIRSAAGAAVAIICLAFAAGIAVARKHHRVRPPPGAIVSRAISWTDVAVQPDGKIVSVGWRIRRPTRMVAVRRLQNGRADPSFARPVIPFATPAAADLVALQPDGKIILAGTVSTGSSPFLPKDFALARLLPDGQLDPSFGSGGVTRTDFGGDDFPAAIALQPDGRILVSGGTDTSGPLTPNSDSRFAVARYQPNGSPDPTLDADGKMVIGFGDSSVATAVASLPGGGVAVAGVHNAQLVLRVSDVAQARLTANGSLDPGFGNGGKLLTPFLSPADVSARGITFANASAMEYATDGQLVAAGPVGFDRGRKHLNRAATERFRTDGSRDPGFGSSGVSLLGFRTLGQAGAFLLPTDGSILIAGGGSDPSSLQLVRLLTNGSLDRSFGRKGAVRTRLPGFNGFASGLAADARGRMVVAGLAEITEEHHVSVLARYKHAGNLDKGFGPRHKRSNRKHLHHR